MLVIYLKTSLFFLCQILGHDINPKTEQLHDVPHTKQSNLEIRKRRCCLRQQAAVSLEGGKEETKIWHSLTYSTREGNGDPLQHSCLENPMDGGAWKAAVHGVAEGRARLSDFTLTLHFHALEKEMATHSSVLAWRIPGTGEPGGLPSMGSHRVGHD